MWNWVPRLPISMSKNARKLTAAWICLIVFPFFIPELRDWWAGKIFTPYGMFAIVAFTIFGSMTEDRKKPFIYKLTIIGIWILVVVSVWFVFGDKVQKSWAEHQGQVQLEETRRQVAVQKVVADRAKAMEPYTIIAESSRFGKKIPFDSGPMIRPEGPIRIKLADGREFDDDKGADSPNLPPTPWVRIKSRIEENVTVTIEP